MDPPTAIAVGPAVEVPLSSDYVPAGFPSPAEDHEEAGLDLTRRFVRRPSSTFVVRASGQSLTGLGIFPGDYLVVDRSRTPRHGDVVIALVDGAFTAKRFQTGPGGAIVLAAANPAYRDVAWRDGCEVWGVVSSVHRDLATD